MSERDLFANFDRMRREMDELFGDAFERSGLSRRAPGHWPAVDVAYASDPPRAIVTAELAGVEADQIALQIEGRTLILAGRRALPSPRVRSTSRSRSSAARFAGRSSSAPTSVPTRRPRTTRTGCCASNCRSSSASRTGGAPCRSRAASRDDVIEVGARTDARRSGRRRPPAGERSACCRCATRSRSPSWSSRSTSGRSAASSSSTTCCAATARSCCWPDAIPSSRRRPGAALRGRRARHGRADGSPARRDPAGPDPGRPARPGHRLDPDRAVSRGRGRGGARRGGAERRS